jgi:hypothetical protein
MGLKATIAKAVNSAFDKASDLAIVSTFSRTQSNSFDFSTASATETTLADVTAKLLIIKDYKTKDGLKRLKILVKTVDVNLYDTVSINNEIWKIGNVIESNRYTTLLEVYRNG